MARIATVWCVFGGFLCILPFTFAQNRVSCYDNQGRAQRCKPPFVNAAFNLPVEATNTCGMRGPSEFCMQTGITGVTQSCGICNARDPGRTHPSSYLTDFHQEANLTWWQSETMLDDIQYPSTVNLTLHLGKTFDITYVRLKFYTSRPESFAIYKRTTGDSEWIPYQYYSQSCYNTYGLRNRDIITRDDETKALCTDEYSDISPLSGASVAFSTLEGRPSAYDFEHSPVLQEWVTATEIRIVLNRLNTFGDEVFGDPNVLRSYFYAISDFAVGGKCQCNGHSSECVWSTGQGLDERLVCRCEHNTMGPNCGECLPFYNDRPWGRATNSDANECLACNCNNLSNRCYFDQDLYDETGHGGHCLECRANTAGPNCERCKDYHFRASTADRCMPCQCHPIGSETEQCDSSGQCRCKPGVTGAKCDRCEENYYDFGPSGCSPCECTVEGSRDNIPECFPDTGVCQCKELVEGRNCESCKPGYFGLDVDNTLGCTACFCYGHSSQCQSARNYYQTTISSDFTAGDEMWTGRTRSGEVIDVEYSIFTENIGLYYRTNDIKYYVAPAKFLGDLRFAYNQYLSFFLSVGGNGARASVQDVVIEGNGLMISLPIYAQGNPVPQQEMQEYRFRLNEHRSFQWSPALSSLQYQSLLANVTSLRIRSSYTPDGNGNLDTVTVETASRRSGPVSLRSIERCTCPEGYIGQFCESCAPGYKRNPANGGLFAKCIPCVCNGHSEICDVNSGRCICDHNTVGANCERCAPGYYGNALAGTPDDCTACPCPGGGECVQLQSGDVVCLNCPDGYAGNLCDVCSDGYYGDPVGRYGPRSPCDRCACNENIDSNAILNCNSTTGECLKCIYNTAGFYCDECLPGYYGDALALPKGDCQACNCYPPGSMPSRRDDEILECERETGQCSCQVRVIGQLCDQCQPGYWNIDSGTGCERCNCDRVGSTNSTCDFYTGQCICKAGVSGRRCEDCQQNHYGFSSRGCYACECNPEGSYGLQCEAVSGQCPCMDNVEGRTCDRCMENKYDISAGCVDCPACYNLVQDSITILRTHINELRIIIETIGDNPQAINDTDFRMKMAAVNSSVMQLWEDAKDAIGGDGSLAEQLEALQLAVENIMAVTNQITHDIVMATERSENSKLDTTDAEALIDAAEERLMEAQTYVEVEGQAALRSAREAQERFGQQSERMTQIAQEARDEVTRQEMEAAAMAATAETAFNTSKEAWDVSQAAIRKPDETARDIESIQNDLESAQVLYDQTKALSDLARAQAEEAHKASLKIYSEALSIDLPSVDPNKLKEATNHIKSEAALISSAADQAMEQHEMLMEDIARQQAEAAEMLESGRRQQQVADNLLAEADFARETALNAVNHAEQTLIDADETLSTLKEFDKKVQESKAEADEALKAIPDIEAAIETAENKTRDAREDLADAMADAMAAKAIAEAAQSEAEGASEEASRISSEAQVTMERAEELRAEAERLEMEVANATSRLVEYELRAEEDERLAAEAQEKADQAYESVRHSSNQVAEALQSMEAIMRQLNNLDSIDVDQLDTLEINLNAAEGRLLEANIASRYESLVESQRQQSTWVHYYTDELTQLRKDVENVGRINATIPRVCFKDVILEPTAPQK